MGCLTSGMRFLQTMCLERSRFIFRVHAAERLGSTSLEREHGTEGNRYHAPAVLPPAPWPSWPSCCPIRGAHARLSFVLLCVCSTCISILRDLLVTGRK